MTSSSSDSDFHVTFSLPSSAAALLKELADGGNQGLRDLGVVSVQINSPAFRKGCAVSSRKHARESEVPFSANTSHLDKLSLSCHSFPSQDDLENTRQNIRHYLTMQSADRGHVDYVSPKGNSSAPTQPPLDMPRHIPDMRPVNALGHSFAFAEASQLPVGHRLDSARSLVSEVDHGHQKHNADTECWKPPGSSYWNWQQNHYRLAYADVAVDGYGPHSGLARPVSPMYARSPPYAFNPCSPRMRTGYQMLPPSHFQEPFAHLESERAWQHTSHTTSPYLMNLLHSSNSSHAAAAAKNQRLAGPFETVLALPPGQTKKKFHRSRKDVALTRSGSHAIDPSSAVGSSGSAYDGPGTLGFGPEQSSFAFPIMHNVCRPDGMEQNQHMYAAAKSAYVNKSQANAFSAPSYVVSTSCLVTSPPAFAMPTSAHVATTAAYVISPSERVMLTPAHAVLPMADAVSTSSHGISTSKCSELPRAPDISTAIDHLISTPTNLMSSSAHAVSTPAHLLPTSHVFSTSANAMSAPQHPSSTSTHAISLPKDVFTVPLCHVMSVSSHSFSDSSTIAIKKPVQVASVPSFGITSPTVKQLVMTGVTVNTARANNAILPLTHVGSADISPEISGQQYFRSNYSESGVTATDKCRPDWSSKSKIQDDCSVWRSLKEYSTNLNTSSHAEQVCNGELEKLPDLTRPMNKTTCSVERNFPLAILPAVGFMEIVHKDQGSVSRSSELISAREDVSADCDTSSNEISLGKAITLRKPEDAEPQPDSAVMSSICNPSSTVDKMLQETLVSSVSSSLVNEMNFIDCKGSIPQSVAALPDYGKNLQNKSEEGSSMSSLLPQVTSNACSYQITEDELRVSTLVVADSKPAAIDNGQARLQHANIVVQENFNSEKFDGSQTNATSGKQSVRIATDTIECLNLVVDTVTNADSTEGSNGVHEKDDSLELAVGHTTRNVLQEDETSQQAVNRSFQTKFDASLSNDMQEAVDGADEASSSTKMDTGNTHVTSAKMQTRVRVQNVYDDVFTSSTSEQPKCNNGMEIGDSSTVSNNGVESVNVAQMLHDNESVDSITATTAPQLPTSSVKITIDTPSSPGKERFSSVLLRNADSEKLAVNVESAIQDCHLLDGNVKLVVGKLAKICTDHDDGKVMELVDSEQGSVECVQSAKVNLRLKSIKDNLVHKVSHSFEEITSSNKSNVSISGELCSLPVLQPCKEFVQKASSSDDGLRSHSPQAAIGKEMGALIKPGVVDCRSSESGTTTASEDGQNSMVEVSLSSMDTIEVCQYAKSPVGGPSTSEIRATLHSKHLLTNCNALLPAASTSHQISADNDQVILDETVSEHEDCSDQIEPRHWSSSSADCKILAVGHDTTAETSWQGVGIQPNGLILEASASSEVLDFSESHPSEQLRLVESSRTVAGFSRHCVVDVGSAKSCSAETVSTFALNSPLHKEVSLSSDLPPSCPLSCLTAKQEDELSDREPSSPINSSSGLNDEASAAMHSEVLHSGSQTVSLCVASVAEIVSSVEESSTSHSCVRSCTSSSGGDHAFSSKDAKASAFDEDVLSGPPPAKRLRTSDNN